MKWRDLTQRLTDVTKNVVESAHQYQQRLNTTITTGTSNRDVNSSITHQDGTPPSSSTIPSLLRTDQQSQESRRMSPSKTESGIVDPSRFADDDNLPKLFNNLSNDSLSNFLDSNQEIQPLSSKLPLCGDKDDNNYPNQSISHPLFIHPTSVKQTSFTNDGDYNSVSDTDLISPSFFINVLDSHSDLNPNMNSRGTSSLEHILPQDTSVNSDAYPIPPIHSPFPLSDVSLNDVSSSPMLIPSQGRSVDVTYNGIETSSDTKGIANRESTGQPFLTFRQCESSIENQSSLNHQLSEINSVPTTSHLVTVSPFTTRTTFPRQEPDSQQDHQEPLLSRDTNQDAIPDTPNSSLVQTLQSVPRNKLEKALESALRKLGHLTKLLKEKETEISASHEVAAESIRKLQTLQDHFDSQELEFQQQVESLKSALADAERIQIQTSTHNEELRQLKSDLTSQLELLAQRAEKMSNWGDELMKSQKKIEGLGAERDALLRELQEARVETQQLRNELEETKKKTGAIGTLEQRIVELENEREQLRSEKGSSEEPSEEIKQMQKSMDQKEGELRAIKKSLEQKEVDLEQKNEELKVMEVKLEQRLRRISYSEVSEERDGCEVKSAIDENIRINRDLLEKVKEVEHELDHMKTLHAEAQTALQGKEEEVEVLRCEIRKATGERNEECVRLEEKHDCLRIELERERENVTKLNVELQMKNVEKEMLINELEEARKLKREFQQIQSLLNEKLSEVDGLKSRLHFIEMERLEESQSREKREEEFRLKMKQQPEEIEKYEKKVEIAKANNNHYECRELNEKLISAQNQVEHSQKECEEFKSKMSLLLEELNKEKLKVKKLRTEQDDARLDMVEIRSNSSGLGSQLSKLPSKLHDMEEAAARSKSVASCVLCEEKDLKVRNLLEEGEKARIAHEETVARLQAEIGESKHMIETERQEEEKSETLDLDDELKMLNESLRDEIKKLQYKIDDLESDRNLLETRLENLQQSILDNKKGQLNINLSDLNTSITPPPPPPPPPINQEGLAMHKNDGDIVSFLFVELLQVLEMQAERLGQADSISATEQVMAAVDLVVQTIEERLPDRQRNNIGLGVRRLFHRVKDLSETRLLLIRQVTELQVAISEKSEFIGQFQKHLGATIGACGEHEIRGSTADVNIQRGTEVGIPSNYRDEKITLNVESEELRAKIALLTQEKIELEGALKAHQANITKLTNQNSRMRTLVAQANAQLVESRDTIQQDKIELKESEEKTKELNNKMNQLQREFDYRTRPPTTELLNQMRLTAKPLMKILVPEGNQVWCCLSTSMIENSTSIESSVEGPSSSCSTSRVDDPLLLSLCRPSEVSWWKENELEEDLRKNELKTLQEIHFDEKSKLQSVLQQVEAKSKFVEKRLRQVTTQFDDYKIKVSALLEQQQKDGERVVKEEIENGQTTSNSERLDSTSKANGNESLSVLERKTVSALTAQLEEERAAVHSARAQIDELERRLSAFKIEAENEKLDATRAVEERESERRSQEAAQIRNEAEKTIESLKVNLETSHKRIQTLAANLLEEKSKNASFFRSSLQPQQIISPPPDQLCSQPSSTLIKRNSDESEPGSVPHHHHRPAPPSEGSSSPSIVHYSPAARYVKRSSPASDEEQTSSASVDIFNKDDSLPKPSALSTEMLSSVNNHWTKEIQAQRRRLKVLEGQLGEERKQVILLSEQNEVIKKELRKSETLLKIRLEENSDTTNGVPIEFVRNTILKFLETDSPGSDEHETLMPVLFSIFALTGNEQKQIQVQRRQHSGWLRSIFTSSSSPSKR